MIIQLLVLIQPPAYKEIVEQHEAGGIKNVSGAMVPAKRLPKKAKGASPYFFSLYR